MPPSDLPPAADLPPPLPGAPYRPMREPDGGDNSMRNLAIAAVGVAAVVMGGVYVTSRHHPAGVPVIDADPGPLRVKPANPGGMQVAGGDDSILMNKDGTEADKLTAPPEAPAPQALARQSAQQAMPAPPPAPVAPRPEAAPPAAEASATEQPLPVPHLPAAPPPPAARIQAPAAPLSAAPQHAGRTQVQLGALDTEAAAYAEWRSLTHRFPDLLAGHQPTIVKVDRDGKTLFRLRTGGFDDIAAATGFCTKLRAKGGDCTVAAF